MSESAVPKRVAEGKEEGFPRGMGKPLRDFFTLTLIIHAHF